MPSEQIQWFPGHMAKTRRIIKECLPQVDILINLLDARIPYSSRNPELEILAERKPVLTLLSKSMLADPKMTSVWKEYYEKTGQTCLFIDSLSSKGVDGILPAIKNTIKDKLDSYDKKGMQGRRIKAMVVGIPNSGKSTLINRLAGSKKAKAEDRPGVTLTKQWVSTDIGIDLLDMPGVLWPKFDEKRVGENLAITGAISDDAVEKETVAMILCGRLRKIAPELLCARYKLTQSDIDETKSDYDIFEKIARKRGFLISGGEIDPERTSKILLDEFRGGKIGRITLEYPPLT